MIELFFLGALIVMVPGVIAKMWLEKTGSTYQIDNREFAIASAVLLLLAVPIISWVGRSVAISNQVTYQETRNGWESEAKKVVTPCYKNGPCSHTYDCDPHRVSYDCSTTDNKGKVTHKTCTRIEYDKCPYTKEEWLFAVDTTIGRVVMAPANLPTNPNLNLFRSNVEAPSYLPSGVPPLWQEADNRIRNRQWGPVSLRFDYANYVLASQSTILHKYNDSIAKYKEKGWLPAIAFEPYKFYQLDRVYFIHTQPAGDQAEWQRRLTRFNAALGTLLQGDLHLVIVNSNEITDRYNYSGALFAYWVSPAFDKNALAKNAIVLILGTRDNKTIEWATCATGMPKGNEALAVQLAADLPGQKLEFETLLGKPSVSISDKLVVQTTGSLLENIIITGPNKFERVHMTKQSGKGAGYEYLLHDIEPTTSQKVWIYIFVFLSACLAWGICIYADSRYRR